MLRRRERDDKAAAVATGVTGRRALWAPYIAVMMSSTFVAIGIACLAIVVACAPSDSPLTQSGTQLIEGCIAGPTVSPASATLHPGDTLRATASKVSCTGEPLRYRWTSSDSTIAMVDADAGLIHAVKPGSVSIIATQTDKPAVKGAMAVLVNP